MKRQNPWALPNTSPLSNIIALAALLTLGCSGPKDGPGSGPDPLSTKTGFCKAWATNACNATVVERCQAPDAAGCINSQQIWCQSALPSGYQSDNAQVCLDAVTAAYSDGVLSAEDIDVVLHFGEPCNQLIRGSSSDGGSCTNDYDCDTLAGEECIIKFGETAGACHVAVEIGGGDPCSAPDELCEDGYFCDEDSNCIRRLAEGAACDFDTQCAADLRCVLGEPTDAGAPVGTCEARRALSAICIADVECESNYCSIASGDADGLCTNSIQLAQREPVCEDLR